MNVIKDGAINDDAINAGTIYIIQICQIFITELDEHY